MDATELWDRCPVASGGVPLTSIAVAIVRKQLFCFLFPVRRLLHSFRALAGAVRGSDVIRVVVLFLHFDLKNKATSFSTQELLQNLGYTKVTSGCTATAACAHPDFKDCERPWDDRGRGAQ